MPNKTFLLTGLLLAAIGGCAVEQGAKQGAEDGEKEYTTVDLNTLPAQTDRAETAGAVAEPELALEEIVNSAEPRMSRPRSPQVASDHAAKTLVLPAPMPRPQEVDRENYLAMEDNPVKRAAEHPVSTFSVDVDTAAYSNIRRMIMREGRLPPGDAVKAEELINYFSYNYPVPTDTRQPFSITTEVAPSPWHAERLLLQVGLKGYQPATDNPPPANLVFLVDVSGSMQSPFKLELVKRSLRMLVNEMSARDRLALAVYAGAAGLVLESTPADRKLEILNAIDALEAGGSTNGGAGLQLAYNTARQHFIDGGINRVIIASDGDMNVGVVNHEQLKDLIRKNRESGIALTTLGFGTGNYNYALMEQLADVGNGNAAYIDSLKEAHKVLVKERHSTLHTIAKDVKIQIEFNPAQVAEYRLIGYENRLLRREDFRNDKVDAGDIGAGHTVTALYEIALVDSAGIQIDPLRYQQGERIAPTSENAELAFVRLRYKQPDADESQEVAVAVKAASIRGDIRQASANLRFAAAVAGYAQILRGGIHTGEFGYPQVAELAREARESDPNGYRAEFISLVELSQSLAQNLVQR
ncbi:VWA domain-containing protein [Exilibacterium tricleocarpae]|uniref:VWA domain-containing protein n=1 Tax=Exilibacterium tricleocarpae TaxID=2591008 RepID=A0A545TLN0_9GAMM|nr:VWA domain-containing protein [Exilibacterium tricleocarpae]TQV78086.1 VWA domain-containing protein [Exilibacterium tricleocarpae]